MDKVTYSVNTSELLSPATPATMAFLISNFDLILLSLFFFLDESG